MLTAKILPLPVVHNPSERSISNALAEKGYMRHPGTAVGFVPIKAPSGKYLTGLDDTAEYINKMAPEEQPVERRKIKERRERLEAATGLDLGPRSTFYSGVYDSTYAEGETAARVKLIDGPNIFNFSNAHKEIEYWWVIQNDRLIARSLESYQGGREKSTVQFYISNPVAEAEAIYNKNSGVTKALATLEKLKENRAFSIAKLMGYPVSKSDTKEIVYNYLYKGITEGTVKQGDNAGRNSVSLFNDIAALSDKVREIKELVKDAITYRVFTVRQGVIYEGESPVAQSEAELISDMALDSKQMELLALKTKVADKEKMRAQIS